MLKEFYTQQINSNDLLLSTNTKQFVFQRELPDVHLTCETVKHHRIEFGFLSYQVLDEGSLIVYGEKTGYKHSDHKYSLLTFSHSGKNKKDIKRDEPNVIDAWFCHSEMSADENRQPLDIASITYRYDEKNIPHGGQKVIICDNRQIIPIKPYSKKKREKHRNSFFKPHLNPHNVESKTLKLEKSDKLGKQTILSFQARNDSFISETLQTAGNDFPKDGVGAFRKFSRHDSFTPKRRVRRSQVPSQKQIEKIQRSQGRYTNS